MANVHNLFETFNSDISLPDAKAKKMITSREALRQKIRDYFSANHSEYKPVFYIQGSYKMNSVIRTKEDVCDLDDGVYFFREIDVKPETLQSWVRNAVDGHTKTDPQHRNKCVRVIFAGEYEIDMPVYYIDEKTSQCNIAIKSSNSWRSDDPKAMIKWFNDNKDANGKVLKMVKYLKAWCDHKSNYMPSGLSMTILATNANKNIVFDNRDDVSLWFVLKEIKKQLSKVWECKVPVSPYDDLFEHYTDIQKNNFLSALDSFIEDANKAIAEPNYLKASELWAKHLGDRFPKGENENDTEAKLAGLLKSAVLIEGQKAHTNKELNITENSQEGVKNKPHHFYGE